MLWRTRNEEKMVSAWLRALREKSSGLHGPELSENDGWPGSLPPTGFQPKFPPRPRGGDPESCPGVPTRVSLSASRWGPDVLFRVPTQVLPRLRGGDPASCPGVPQGRDPMSCSGSRPISPLGVGGGAAGTRRFIPGSRPEFPISTVGWGDIALCPVIARGPGRLDTACGPVGVGGRTGRLPTGR